MDPTLIQQAPSGLDAWIQNNQALIQVVLWCGQLLYWVGMVVLVIVAVVQLKRWVDYATGATAAKAASAETKTEAPAEEKSEKKEAIKVEDFVE